MSPQVLAYSLGLGTLVQDEKKLTLHMKAELDHNDSPYGLLVMTGMNQTCTLLCSGHDLHNLCAIIDLCVQVASPILVLILTMLCG